MTAAPEEAAERYWRYVCLLASAHLLGWTWPPSGRTQRTRIVGHWGCNPGIAWIVGHLAARWHGATPLHLVVGTGHASSFTFAHTALVDAWEPRQVSDACATYGMPGGTPSETVGDAGVPFLGGELGPALAMSQGFATHLAGDAVVACIVGDGECETPVALAALAHARVALGDAGVHRWLPVVNANGSRMGGHSRFTAVELERVLHGFGYDVVVSDGDGTAASEAAAAALAGCAAGRMTAWVSVTDKGWPAPAVVGGHPYRGHRAHKAPVAHVTPGTGGVDAATWADAVAAGFHVGDGRPPQEVLDLARRVTLRAAPVARALRPTAAPPPGSCDTPQWLRPMAAVDETLARLGTAIYSPDEASSNGMVACSAAGLVTEVLAEEVCAAWTWGAVEAGRAAAFVTYEAFAPLASTVLAQYAKMTSVRPLRGVPPLLVVETSLGWANTPTHQNTDLTATLLARDLPGVRVVYPVGASSAAARVADLSGSREGVALLVCSKQQLLDLPDPGGPLVSYRVAGAPRSSAVLVVVGDVCATEAVAAAEEAAAVGIGVEVIAVTEPNRAGPALRAEAARLGPLPVVGAVWCAARHLSSALWQGWGAMFAVHGYGERWGATAAETLRANGLDRWSLLERLAEQDLDALQPVVAVKRSPTALDASGVAMFDPPELTVRAAQG